MNTPAIASALAAALILSSGNAAADSAREAAKSEAASIPDEVQTVAGELTFFDGVPTGDTNDLVYDLPRPIAGFWRPSRQCGRCIDRAGHVGQRL